MCASWDQQEQDHSGATMSLTVSEWNVDSVPSATSPTKHDDRPHCVADEGGTEFDEDVDATKWKTLTQSTLPPPEMGDETDRFSFQSEDEEDSWLVHEDGNGTAEEEAESLALQGYHPVKPLLQPDPASHLAVARSIIAEFRTMHKECRVDSADVAFDEPSPRHTILRCRPSEECRVDSADVAFDEPSPRHTILRCRPSEEPHVEHHGDAPLALQGGMLSWLLGPCAAAPPKFSSDACTSIRMSL
mmetsp:Transcript_27873/g.89754  ORF Transcript_27873/g.89754 Transcript_27873/m.89754 type:complete len:245 (-) Transcript_27873:44-778(-)